MSKLFGSAQSLRSARPRIDLAYPHPSHGRILPMEEPGLIERILRRR